MSQIYQKIEGVIGIRGACPYACGFPDVDVLKKLAGTTTTYRTKVRLA
jgi:hypothetical protein